MRERVAPHEPAVRVRNDPGSERRARHFANGFDDVRGRRPQEHRPSAPPGPGARLGLGTGRELDHFVRASFERLLGVDLSAVRIHDGAAAEEATDAYSADAFAAGTDVALSPRKRPGTPGGDKALAHELAHVAEQARRGRPEIQRQEAPQAGRGIGRKPPEEPFDTADGVGAEDDFVLFDQDRAEVPAGLATTMSRLLRQHPGPVTVDLHGYASHEGDSAYNLNLAAHRAVAVGRAIEAMLPAGSVVRPWARGETESFGTAETLGRNRRVGIDVTPRTSVDVLLGTPRTPGIGGDLRLTVDARLVPNLLGSGRLTLRTPGIAPAPPAAATTATGGTVVLPRLRWDFAEPSDAATRVFGRTPQPSFLTPIAPSRAVGLVDWRAVEAEYRRRGVTPGAGDHDILLEHAARWYPLADAAYRLPLVSRFFDSPNDVLTSMTVKMVSTSLAGDHPDAIESFDRTLKDAGLPTPVYTPSITIFRWGNP